MPPIQKVTREMILEAGYQLVNEVGFENLNSRNIANLLCCSTQPVFSQFPNMNDLKLSVHDYACEIFENDVIYNVNSDSFFQSSYTKLINLARMKRNIFKLIYLSEYCLGNDFMKIRMNYRSNLKIAEEFKQKYALEENECNELVEKISLFIHGIATTIATTSVDFNDEKIESMIETALCDTVNGIKERRM